ncbi:RNPEP [Branchiostoma lanceolatum]|uniref:RNPEP protein n=1 Tax=Branchiostoma lanceolatum TaxID=7740 RepID=A0A8K0E4X9_BRALA|nr:RNPEP [Branchiostoma lanceolatum]
MLTTFMGIHNCPSGRPLHHQVDPWCVRIWREGVRDRQSFPRVVRIKYRTTPEGGSLTWVTDQDGKPCVFTQGSCINNRSLFPCHDFLTMATWQAVVHAPHGATVLMSGEEPGAPWQPEAVAWQPDTVTKQPDTGIPVVKQTDSTQEEEFVSTDVPAANELTSFSEQMHEGVASVAKQCDVAKQQADTEAQVCSDIASRDHHYFYVTMPMPCSTLALAVGYWLQASSEESTTQEQNHLQPSIQVFAPAIHVQQAGREFLPLIEKYLSAAYDVLGPHPLPRLDVLMVPRCFASLGLASPHLMMVSQSLLAGDGSMCLRLAHEIAHSWFGLLIGSRDWTEEWISEGFATYLEDCIHAKAMGWTERESQEYSDLRASIRYRLLSAELENTEEELQTLRPSASGQGFHQGEGTVYVTNALNTDKLFTQVHYLKGYFLLRYFAKKVGAEKFHSLLKSFVQEFPRHGMNLIFSQDFFNLVFKTFPSLSSQGLTVERIYQDWLDCPGLPKQLQKNPVNASNILVKQVKETLKHWKDVDRQNRRSEREARKMTKTRRNPTGNTVKRKERQEQSRSLDEVCDREESMDGKNAVVHDGKRSYDVSKCLTDPDFSPPKNKCQAIGDDIPNKSSNFECSEQLSNSQSDVPHRTDLPVTSLINEGGVSAHDSKGKEPGKGLLQDQLVLFLEELLEMNSVASATLQRLEEHYRLSKCNADVRHRWCELVIKHGYSPGYKDVQRFLCEDQAMGVYLYGELMAYEQSEQQQLARETFNMLSQEMEEGPRKAVQEMLYGDLVDEREMGV